MCRGGRLLADFCAGTKDRPAVPRAVRACLTITTDGVWLVEAHKLARPMGDRFQPMSGGDPYPADAVAACRVARDLSAATHAAPQPDCTCGFHALSEQWPSPQFPGLTRLEVVLSGRVLAFEWPTGGVLFRAARQTVVRSYVTEEGALRGPVAGRRRDDPEGTLALVERDCPRSAGPVRLRLPRSLPPAVVVSEHAGYCPSRQRPEIAAGRPLLLTPV